MAGSLARSWEIQRKVIGALLMREVLTRYGRHNIGFLWLFVEPMIFTVGVTVLWSASGANHGTSLPIVAFAVTGYSTVLMWRNMPARCIGAIHPNLALMFHRNVKVIDIFLSRLILEGGGATISFIVLSLFFSSIGWMALPEDISKVIIGWFMLAWFGMALAIFLGSLSEKSEIVEKLWHPASYLTFPLSGAGFLVDIAPPSAQKALLYVPMVNCAEYIREGYFGTKVHSHYDMGYVAVCCSILSIFALAQARIAAREVIPG